MGKKYTADELNNCSKETLITILLSMQDQTERLNQNMERLIEQIAVSNQEKFGRKSEKLEVMKGQLNLSDFDALFNEVEFLTQNLYVVEPYFDDICKDEVVERKKKKKGKRETDLKDFEVEIISHELNEEQLKEIFGDCKRNGYNYVVSIYLSNKGLQVHGCIPFARDAGSNYYCFSRKDNRILFWDHEECDEFDGPFIVCKNFKTFVNKLFCEEL